MKKLRSQKAETLVETLMAIVVVVLVMLFLSTAVSTASKVNAKVRKTDVALTYENAVKGSEAKTLIIKDKNSATKIIHVQVDEYKSKNGYTYYRKRAGGGNLKLKDKKGLTLVEMLCTVAVLVLVSMVMVLGVQLGVRSYAKSVSYSEAQVLCSTLTTTISDELRYSGTLKVDGSGNVTGFFSQQFGSGDYTAFTTTPEGHVQLGGKDILPAKAYPYGIKAKVESLTYDDGSSLFTVQLSVKDSENKNTLAETTFEVEKLNVTTEDTAEGRARAEDIRNTEN